MIIVGKNIKSHQYPFTIHNKTYYKLSSYGSHRLNSALSAQKNNKKEILIPVTNISETLNIYKTAPLTISVRGNVPSPPFTDKPYIVYNKAFIPKTPLL